CAKCSGGVTPIGQLFSGVKTGAVVSAAFPEEVAATQIAILQKWIASCSHTAKSEITCSELPGGSEHLVFVDAETQTVYKVTRPTLYGDSYFLDATGKINQQNCSPLEYLIRLRLWKKLFQSAPRDLGISHKGQIISSHQFITGTKPAQESVDKFLSDAGLSAVRQNYWLWKKTYPDFEIWVGDAREDNFVETEAGIVPIDIRLWFAGHTPSTESNEW
ncbi:MAG: hypothetical protein M3Y82_00030, partial [Verrucomicrobiota bacterium]|nr:hypothetical protein [Verrucomicrobiota bacterium]